MPETRSAKVQDLESENRRLRGALQELSILNEVAYAIGSASTVNAVVELVVQKCVKHLAVEQAAVLLFQEEENSDVLHTMVRRVQTDAQKTPYRLNDQIVGWVLKKQAPLLINDFATDGRFQSVHTADSLMRSLMCAPLRLKGRIIGVLSAFNKRSPEGFTDSDQRLLMIIASQSAQVIENARLYEEESALRLMQQELRLAREIQTNLLPGEAPSVPGYEIAGKTVPASNVGGDYFDFIAHGENKLAVCLGDVSGKGIPAAVLMACVQATIRGQTLLACSPGVCLERASELLQRSSDAHTFVTLFYSVLDHEKHRLLYSNAGHNPPILLSEGRDPQLLTVGGPVLGVKLDLPFEEAQVGIEPGDLLVAYSDGFTEAMNSHSEEFGEARLLEALLASQSSPPAVLIDKMYDCVEKHCGGAPQHDDMTIVVVHRKR